MRLKTREREVVIRRFATDYRRAGKKEKGKILDRVVRATGYLRRYAARLNFLRCKFQGVAFRR